MKDCPRCLRNLTLIERKGQCIEACEACGGGVMTETAFVGIVGGQAAPSEWSRRGLSRGVTHSELSCPSCRAAPVAMEQHSLAYRDQHVEIDRCPRCGSLWLDASEGHIMTQIAVGLRFDDAEAAPHPVSFDMSRLNRTTAGFWFDALDRLLDDD